MSSNHYVDFNSARTLIQGAKESLIDPIDKRLTKLENDADNNTKDHEYLASKMKLIQDSISKCEHRNIVLEIALAILALLLAFSIGISTRNDSKIKDLEGKSIVTITEEYVPVYDSDGNIIGYILPKED